MAQRHLELDQWQRLDPGHCARGARDPEKCGALEDIDGLIAAYKNAHSDLPRVGEDGMIGMEQAHARNRARKLQCALVVLLAAAREEGDEELVEKIMTVLADCDPWRTVKDQPNSVIDLSRATAWWCRRPKKGKFSAEADYDANLAPHTPLALGWDK